MSVSQHALLPERFDSPSIVRGFERDIFTQFILYLLLPVSFEQPDCFNKQTSKVSQPLSDHAPSILSYTKN